MIGRAGAWLLDAAVTVIVLAVLISTLTWLGEDRFDAAATQAIIVVILVIAFLLTPMLV